TEFVAQTNSCPCLPFPRISICISQDQDVAEFGDPGLSVPSQMLRRVICPLAGRTIEAESWRPGPGADVYNYPARGQANCPQAHYSIGVSMSTIRIADRIVGDDQPCFIVAEIGINHNGDVDFAKRLISGALAAGCDAIKFQQRTVEVVYSQEELAKPRENPFGPTNGDLKYGLEFGQEEYEEIDAFCKSVKMLWFASPWDEGSVDFLERFD